MKRIEVPWAQKGNKFTLLFEQTAKILVKEMPVLTTARILEMTDKRLWRIVLHYVKTAMNKIDRWATLKKAEGQLTESQSQCLGGIGGDGLLHSQGLEDQGDASLGM